MNKLKNSITKFVFSGVVIFILGILIGYHIDNGAITSIQGYLLDIVGLASDPNASDSNASDANASDANASDANASDANASDANASNANAVATDNIIYLENFALGSTSVNPGDKVNVVLTTSGACNSAASIVFKNSDGTIFTVKVQNITDTPYIVIPDSAAAATYSVTDILLVGRNSDNTTFTKQYSKTGANTYAFNSKLTVNAKKTTGSTPKATLNNISFGTTSANVGDKVYLNIQATGKIDELKLTLTSNDSKTFTVYAKDLSTGKPYIEIPSSTKAAVYELTNAVITSSNDSIAYSKNGTNGTLKASFNPSLEVKDTTKDAFIYNNEDINSDVLTKLYNAPEDTEITINAESNTLINEELFNTIKGKNKKLIINYKDNQIVFNGKDINNSKTIDVSMAIENVSNNESINKLVSDGIVISFPDNGDLPGEALIRVKSTEEMNKVLDKKVYVYVYNDSTNDFCLIDTNAKKTSDGYYEFSITHNSDYLMVNNKLDSKLVSSRENSNIVSFQKGNRTYLLLIGIGIILIIATAVVVTVLSKKKK